MGCFSWLDCKRQSKRKADRAIRIGDKAYLLIPKEFSEKYGAHIEESCYDGYGHFGGYDVYEVVALLNREHIGVENLGPKPNLNQFGGLWNFEIEELKKKGLSEDEIKVEDKKARQTYYDRAVKGRKVSENRLKDFINGVDDAAMLEKYGQDYLRLIGIDIACYDDQNNALEYPIKITHDEYAVYEKCNPSDGDPNQGC